MIRVKAAVRGRLRPGLAALVVIGLACAAVWPGHGATTVTASVPEIILQINDTTVSPLDDRYLLSVYLTNVLQEVAGLEVTISAGTSGLMRLPDSVRIETTIVCIDPSDCIPADTTLDTIPVSPIDLTGSVIAGWDFIQARALSAYTFRIAAVADFPGGGTPPPIPVATSGPHLLLRMVLKREASPEVLDTLQDRTVNWLISAPTTSFSDRWGNSIGLQESTICLNPPACDSLDTIKYYDPAINIYVDGATTFGSPCIRGDANGDGIISSADIVYLVNFMFKMGVAPGCNGQAGDADCSGSVSSADIIYLVNYVYKGGPPPCSG